MSLSSAVSFAALTVAVGAGAVLYAQNQALQERVGDLEQTRLTAEVSSEAAAKGPDLKGSRTAQEVAELRRMTDALVARVDQNETAVRSIADGTTEGTAKAAVLRTQAFQEAVREVVLEMAGNDAAFRAKVGTQDRTKVPKDAPFARLAEVLELDAAQESQMSKDLQEIQQELFGILTEERDDGVVPMEMIAKAEALKEGDPKKAQIFVSLFTLEIPGSDETYMQRAVKLASGFRKKATTYLRPAQVEIWQNLDVDLFSIKFD